jgi:hypothetical protein
MHALHPVPETRALQPITTGYRSCCNSQLFEGDRWGTNKWYQWKACDAHASPIATSAKTAPYHLIGDYVDPTNKYPTQSAQEAVLLLKKENMENKINRRFLGSLVHYYLFIWFCIFNYFWGFVYSRENEVCSPKVRNFFHPKDQTKIYLLPGSRKRLFSRSHPEKCQRPVPSFFWIYKLNTSLVQIPAIEEYFASRVSKKIIFEVTL